MNTLRRWTGKQGGEMNRQTQLKPWVVAEGRTAGPSGVLGAPSGRARPTAAGKNARSDSLNDQMGNGSRSQ